MKSIHRKMQELMGLWLVLVLTGSSCAIFYTKGTDNDYPRVGKRAFFTHTDKGSNYPRIGRRSSPSLNFDPDDVMSGYGVEDDHHFRDMFKRGIFTTGKTGFPRIGRSQGGAEEEELTAAVMTSRKGPDVMTSEEQERRYEIPLGLLFFDFDKNGDKKLSRDEFVQGMTKAQR